MLCSRRRGFGRVLLALLPLALSSSCVLPAREQPLSAPSVLIQLENLNEEELRVVQEFFAAKDFPTQTLSFADGPGREYSWAFEVELPSWESQEKLHRELTELRAPSDDHQILHNFASSVLLRYTSSAAHSEAQARIEIRVEPEAAALYLDTEIPGVESPLHSSDGGFEIELPFAVIRDHEALYFHSLYEGQYRYYRYHLEEQRQELILGVGSPAQFEVWLAEQ